MGVGALTVIDNSERLAGIISERDYARKVILKGKASKDTIVTDIMTSNVISVHEETTVEKCMSLMSLKKIRHLPVLKRETLVGIITAGDLFKFVVKQQSIAIEELESYIMGEIARQTLEAAAASGDLTRAGVVAAAQTVEVDLKGLAANINYAGNPNDTIPRETFVLAIDPDLYDAEATMTTGSVGADGLVLIEDGYIGDVARGFEYEPCFGI